MWLKMSEELEMEGLPKRPSTPTPESTSQTETILLKRPESQHNCGTSASYMYSPAMDSNWRLATVIDEEPLDSFENCENSILTTFRRKNPEKYNLLEKRLREPLAEQFKLLRDLSDRVSKDLEQMNIIVNYLEDQLAPVTPKKKRVKFTTCDIDINNNVNTIL
ncbi:uncharacterized protein LOC130050343 [Ostrea edulis]|uniref:uncharacterized protein LOC125647585 n=1 Tax=Ostrea edulis TaxID=37623 RepID=UPI0020952369|nr:uncharacterized protein LOC125647585 [Ostrea edulis]XP_055999801.1 uncharacterized protein LOC130047982 [Ostrea edulis]XP_056002413.1 uncharacterized protein LOC130049187 [Ostrea edulis]XP_056003945.1 uncharacterized protein LOC130049837 [Ostrea edulis]XP_056004770.1 uncharacterized protein LOC130050082 [Ostrea edulis]XP_056006186.1 uncharacterized protein LOC130050343 [Ostrea edulis]